MLYRHAIGFFVLLLTVSLAAGCGGEKRPNGFPKLYLTTLAVTQDGQPLSGATVMLFGQTPELQKWSVGGQTGDGGTAKLITCGKYVGVPEGEFTVVVIKEETETKGEAKMVGGEMAPPPTKIYSVVELKQTRKETATNKVKVEKGKNALKIDIGKKVKVLTGDTSKSV